jgi:hypothetical protein
MITYFYWALVALLAIGAVALIGIMAGKPAVGLLSAAAILLAGWTAYYFHFQQLFVKRWGGVMTISVPAGQYHMGATWKDDNLWIENYEPANNTCHFSEYSKGNLLQGRVTLKNCNPLMPTQ